MENITLSKSKSVTGQSIQVFCFVWQNNIGPFFALRYVMERRTISKGEIICSCRRQNRDNICAVFAGVYAIGSVMESHIISKCKNQKSEK